VDSLQQSEIDLDASAAVSGALLKLGEALIRYHESPSAMTRRAVREAAASVVLLFSDEAVDA